MSKIVSAERHDEVMEKLETIACQLHHLGNATKSIGKTILANSTQSESPAFWEQQCREKDATLTEALRKLQLADEQIAELAEKNGAYVLEILRQRDELADLNVRLHDADITYMGVQIDCPATRAALDANYQGVPDAAQDGGATVTDTPKLDNAIARLTCGACLSPHPCCCPPDAHLPESVLDRYRAARDLDQPKKVQALADELPDEIDYYCLRDALLRANIRLEYR